MLLPEQPQQPHLDSALTQLNNHRQDLEGELGDTLANINQLTDHHESLDAELKAILAGIAALETQAQPPTIPLGQDPPHTTTEPPTFNTDLTNDVPESQLRIVTPLDSTIPGGCPNTTDGNHVANDAGRCQHCGAQVANPID